MKKGIILCGGKGTRMLPATKVMNKHLIPVLNEPMVLFPLRTLLDMGVEDILIVSGGNHIGAIADFLGDGKMYGANFTYKVQAEAGGIAQALLLAEGFVDDEMVVILGDNYFEKAPEGHITKWGILTKEVDDPKRFGVYDPIEDRIVEKPENPPSNQAVTGMYFYGKEVFDFIKNLEPSARGEMEITDVNNWMLENHICFVAPYKDFWSDMGTPESMYNTIKFLKEKV